MTLNHVTSRKAAKKARARPKAPRAPERPWHSRKFGQFTDEWFAACNDVFVEAMLANPSERPYPRVSDPQANAGASSQSGSCH